MRTFQKVLKILSICLHVTTCPTHDRMAHLPALASINIANRRTKTLNTPVDQICIDCSHLKVLATPNSPPWSPLTPPPKLLLVMLHYS